MEGLAIKCQCMGAGTDIGRAVSPGLQKFGIRIGTHVKSLGFGLADGRRRSAPMVSRRLNAFKDRHGGFRRVRAVNKDPARVGRTGGANGMTSGQCCGVAPSVLLTQRHAVDAAIAPEVGIGGSAVDPAYGTHLQPIWLWVKAVRNGWIHSSMMASTCNVAIQKSHSGDIKFAEVIGSAAAMVATATRNFWTVVSDAVLVTDDGSSGDEPSLRETAAGPGERL